jgi:hypothetical protein
MTESGLPVFPFYTPPELDAEPEYAEPRRKDPVPKVRLALRLEARDAHPRPGHAASHLVMQCPEPLDQPPGLSAAGSWAAL